MQNPEVTTEEKYSWAPKWYAGCICNMIKNGKIYSKLMDSIQDNYDEFKRNRIGIFIVHKV